MEVIKDLEPNDDPGAFDLQVDGSTELADAGDGDSTGAVTLDTGDHTVGEAAGSSTSMANYASSIECVEHYGEGFSVVASGMGAGPLAIEVDDGDEIVCTITNTRVSVGIVKTNDAGESATVEPGDTIHYTLTVTVSNGPATGVVVTDTLPDGLTYAGGSADPADGFSDSGQDLTWTVGDLAEGAHTFEYDATVDEGASGELANLGCVDADQNHDFALFDLLETAGEDGGDLPCDETTVLVQHLSIEKTNGADGDVLPGSIVGFTLELSVTNGPIDSVTIVDDLPTGLGDATAISDGGIYDAAANTIWWTLSDVADGRELTYSAAVSATATDGELTNVATITDGPCVGDGCDDDSTVTVLVPVLRIVVREPVCDGNVPYLEYEVEATGTDSTTVTITWINPDGDDIVYADLPFAGRVLWPGAVVDGDTAVDWPGWTLLPDGTWVAGDEFDWVRPSAEVMFEVNPSATTTVAYPPSTPTCDANPPQGGELGGNPTPTPAPVVPDTAMPDASPVGSWLSIPVAILLTLFVGSLVAFGLAIAKGRQR